MTCKDIQHRLTLGESLDDKQSAHADSCDACRVVMAEQSAVSRSLKMVAAAEPPIGSAERAFRAAMAGESAIKAPSFLERLLPVATPFAAGAAAAAVIALLIGTPAPSADAEYSVDVVASGLLSDDVDGIDDDVAVAALLALGEDE